MKKIKQLRPWLSIDFLLICGVLFFNYERFYTPELIILLALAILFFLLFDHTQSKKLELILNEPIDHTVADIRGGKYTRKKRFWIQGLGGIALMFNGIINVNLDTNLRIIMLCFGLFILLIEVSRMYFSKNRLPMRAILFEDQVKLYDHSMKKIIAFNEVKAYQVTDHKIKITSDANTSIVLHSNDFFDTDLEDFKEKMEVVFAYWKRKQE